MYVIRKQTRGRRYEVSTRAQGERAAMDQLRRFEADPTGYDPRGAAAAEPLYLDEGLAEGFLAHAEAKGNTGEWLRRQRVYVAWWADRLRGVDLRRASLRDHVLPALQRATARQHRIAVVKALYGWLRAESRLVSAAEDPTFGTLKVPQSRPAQLSRVKTIPRSHVAAALAKIGEPWRDALKVLAGTGMHVTELRRFAEAGRVEALARSRRDAAGTVVIPWHKSGQPLRVAVSAPVLEAARRLRARGPFDEKDLREAIAAACVAARVPHFTPGRFRHTIATWAVERGADPAAVAAFLGHRSPATTRRFYATHATVRKVPTLA